MNNQALIIDKKNVTVLKNNPYIWRQVYIENNKETVIKTDMRSMSKEHIIKAALKCQQKIAELYKKANGWEDLLEKLETVASEKGFEIEEINNSIIKHSSDYKKGILTRD